MHIVLIEDDVQKAESVIAVLRSVAPSATIELCRSYQSGLKYLEEADEINLIVLDMSLPTFDPTPDSRQGRPRPLGGYDIIRKLKRRKINTKIVILTAFENFGSPKQQFTFEEIKRKIVDDFPQYYAGAIYYSQSRSDWQKELIQVVEKHR